jgi:cold shock CspA family protein
MPDDPKDYVHRSGRTGRAGADGLVVSFVVDDGHRAMRALQRQVGRQEPIEDVDLERLGDEREIVLTPEPEAPARTRTGERPGRRERAHRQDRPTRGERPERSDRSERGERSERPRRSDRADRGDRPAGNHRDSRDRGRDDRQVAGTVASYNPSKGFGFISRRGGADVFVHVSSIAGRDQTLEPGQRVRFELAPGRRGQQAKNVQPVA